MDGLYGERRKGFGDGFVFCGFCLVGMSNSSKWNSHLLNGQGGVL